MFPSRIILFLVFASIIVGVFGQRIVLNKNEGEVCKSGADPWICKSRNSCPTLRRALGKGIRPDICSFKTNEAIFCCPPEKLFSDTVPAPGSEPTQKPSVNLVGKENRQGQVSVESKANEMCREYSKYVYKNITLAPSLPGQKPKNISLHECSIEPLIVGGVDAKPKEFPHMALVGEENQRQQIDWFCGGSLISPKFVLTAAHCITPNSRFQYWVRIGDLDTSSEKDDSKPVNIKVINKINHPEYNSQLMYHDIALLELETEAKLSTYVRPLCLHTSQEMENDKVLASGWGRTRWRGRTSPKLQKLVMPPVSNQECNEAYSGKNQNEIPKGVVKDLMLCAGGLKGKDTCQGDSGGPLQIQRTDIFCMYSIVGVVSFGKGCALGFPSIYTRVSYYVPWIVNIVWP